MSTDTLRHYERLGLLPRVARTSAGYRLYSPASVERVLLIQRALIIGFSLSDLARILAVRDRGGAPCRSVRELVRHRLNGLEQRIEDLSALRDDLRVLMKTWDSTLATTPPGKQAHLLDTLSRTPSIERARKTGTGRARNKRGVPERTPARPHR